MAALVAPFPDRNPGRPTDPASRSIFFLEAPPEQIHYAFSLPLEWRESVSGGKISSDPVSPAERAMTLHLEILTAESAEALIARDLPPPDLRREENPAEGTKPSAVDTPVIEALAGNWGY